MAERGDAARPSTHLSPRSSQDTIGDVQRVLRKLEASGRNLPILRLLANGAHTFRPFVLMANALVFEGVLPPLIRETVILDLAARLGSRYEWDEHVPMSAEAGITEAMRDALARPASGDLAPLTDEQRTAVRLCRAIAARALSDADWDEACALWGSVGALELVEVVAWWGGLVPTIISAMERHGLSAQRS